MIAKTPIRTLKHPPAVSDICVTVRVFQIAHFLVKTIRMRKADQMTTNVVDHPEGFVDRAFSSVERTLKQYLPQQEKRTTLRKARDESSGVRKTYAVGTAQKSKYFDDMDWAHSDNNQEYDRTDLPLTRTASDIKRLGHGSELQLDALSWVQLAQMLLVVGDAIHQHHVATERRNRLLSNGSEPSCCFEEEDEEYWMTWEYMLQKLRQSLINALTRKTLEILESPERKLYKGPEWRKLRKALRWHYRYNICWFNEYADVRHPLSTTWPWNIKNSLAVIWGVCWMFEAPVEYSAGGPWRGDNDSYTTVAQHRLLQTMWSDGGLSSFRDPGKESYVTYGLNLIGRGRSPLAQSGDEHEDHEGGGVPLWRGSDIDASPRHCQGPGVRGSHPIRASLEHHKYSAAWTKSANELVNPATYAVDDQYILNASPAYDASVPSPILTPSPPAEPCPWINNTAAPIPATERWPDLATSSGTAHIGLGHQDNSSQHSFFSPEIAPLGLRNQSRRRSHLSAHLPPRSSQSGIPRHPDRQLIPTPRPRLLRPELTVTAPDSLSPIAAPPFDTYDEASPSPARSPHFLTANSHIIFPNHSMRISSTEPHYFEPGMSTTHTSQFNNNTNIANIPNATSPVSPVSITMEDQPQKTSPYNDQPHSRSHSSPRSHRSNSLDGGENGEYLQGRKNYSHKRPEEPPRNNQNKMICKFAETSKDCLNLTFDRKCEWSKHMDKHDRPYKCSARGCEKLRGFTYSGGLLRHEREVHKMHGGTKKSLFCPHADCKRSSGTGFTRKENLAEHIRRVHRTSSGMIDASDLPQGDHKVFDDRMQQHSPDAVNDWQDTTHVLPTDGVDPQLEAHDAEIRKRKRMSTDRTDGSELGDFDGVDLRAEVKRLRRENEEKDARLKKLEETVQILQARG